MIEFISSLGVGGSLATLGLVALVGLYGFRAAKVLSSASTIVLVVVALLVGGTLLGWLDLSALVGDVSVGIRMLADLLVGVLERSLA